jgi:flagellar biosynthesis chaperone FliJ
MPHIRRHSTKTKLNRRYNLCALRVTLWNKNHQEGHGMKKWIAVCLPVLSVLLSSGTLARSQGAQKQASPAAMTDAQQKNLQEYIELLRSNVREQKDEVLGFIMALDVDQSAKFWPIYREYDAELTKLNDLRVANIQEYAHSYDQMTEAKADELIQNAFQYRKQRSELLAKYYGRVKDSLGAIEAARFLQIEDQLLAIIDLQIASASPIVGQEH